MPCRDTNAPIAFRPVPALPSTRSLETPRSTGTSMTPLPTPHARLSAGDEAAIDEEKEQPQTPSASRDGASARSEMLCQKRLEEISAAEVTKQGLFSDENADKEKWQLLASISRDPSGEEKPDWAGESSEALTPSAPPTPSHLNEKPSREHSTDSTLAFEFSDIDEPPTMAVASGAERASFSDTHEIPMQLPRMGKRKCITQCFASDGRRELSLGLRGMVTLEEVPH